MWKMREEGLGFEGSAVSIGGSFWSNYMSSIIVNIAIF